MAELGLAICLVLIIEGMGPLLFPNRWRTYLAELAKQPSDLLRTFGGVLVTAGAVGLWFLLM